MPSSRPDPDAYEATLISYGNIVWSPTPIRGKFTALPTNQEKPMSFRAQLANVAERTAWTFAQTFLGVFVVTDISTARTAAVAAVASAIVPVKEFVKHRREVADDRADYVEVDPEV